MTFSKLMREMSLLSSTLAWQLPSSLFLKPWILLLCSVLSLLYSSKKLSFDSGISFMGKVE